MVEETKQEKTKVVAKREPTPGEKFTNMVVREFGATVSDSIEMTPYQRHLAQHLFIKVDATLKELETKRLASNQTGRQPITWSNINMMKLAPDVVHRVDLGLDALIANHIHPIPYWNSKEGKYDLDLRVGYAGKDFYRRRMVTDVPITIIYELVYSTDKFKPIKRNLSNEVESYEFEITQPFDRGEIVGGFGYIVNEDSRKNQLVIVTEKDFQKSKGLAKTADFWTKNPVEMRYKTLVLRVTEKLQVDPRKVNASYLAVEAADDEQVEAEITTEIEESANQEIIDVDMETGEIVEEQPKAIGTQAAKEAPKRDPASLKTISDMLKACHEDFGLQPKQVIAELGVSSQGDITQTPVECYAQIAAIMTGPETVEEGPGF